MTALTVITLTLPERKQLLDRLVAELLRQADGRAVEHLIVRGSETYGEKMTRGLWKASGDYVCWMDDDDWPMPNYIDGILNAIESEPHPDLVTFGSCSPGCVPAWLRWQATDNQETGPEGNVRCANHYCAWRVEIARSAPWLPRNYGPEYAWYTSLRLLYRDAGLREVHVPEVLHEYRYNAKGTRCQDRDSIHASLSDGGERLHLLRLKTAETPTAVIAKGWEQPRDGRFKVRYPDGTVGTVGEADVELLEVVTYK